MITAFVSCEVTDGPRDGFKTIGVKSVEGWTEYLTIERQFLKEQAGALVLPVRVVGIDQRQKVKLIQLPVEADSGANRVWVNYDSIVGEPDEV